MKKIYFLTAILLVTLLAACQTQVTATQAPPNSVWGKTTPMRMCVSVHYSLSNSKFGAKPQSYFRGFLCDFAALRQDSDGHTPTQC